MSDAGARMVSSIFKEKVEWKRGLYEAQSAAAPMQQENERKMAAPPRRGRGLEWRGRSLVGTATQPAAVAKSRTYRVSTKADSSAKTNVPRKMPVNYATLASRHAKLHARSTRF